MLSFDFQLPTTNAAAWASSIELNIDQLGPSRAHLVLGLKESKKSRSWSQLLETIKCYMKHLAKMKDKLSVFDNCEFQWKATLVSNNYIGSAMLKDTKLTGNGYNFELGYVLLSYVLCLHNKIQIQTTENPNYAYTQLCIAAGVAEYIEHLKAKKINRGTTSGLRLFFLAKAQAIAVLYSKEQRTSLALTARILLSSVELLRGARSSLNSDSGYKASHPFLQYLEQLENTFYALALDRLAQNYIHSEQSYRLAIPFYERALELLHFSKSGEKADSEWRLEVIGHLDAARKINRTVYFQKLEKFHNASKLIPSGRCLAEQIVFNLDKYVGEDAITEMQLYEARRFFLKLF